MTADIEAEPLVFVSFAVGFESYLLIWAFSGDCVHVVKERSEHIPGQSCDSDSRQVVLYHDPIIAGVDQRSHQNERHTRDQSPRPAELDKVRVEYVVLLSEVAARADNVKVFQDGADKQRAHINADLDVYGREDELFEHVDDAHEEKVARRARSQIDVLVMLNRPGFRWFHFEMNVSKSELI